MNSREEDWAGSSTFPVVLPSESPKDVLFEGSTECLLSLYSGDIIPSKAIYITRKIRLNVLSNSNFKSRENSDQASCVISFIA